MPGGPPARVGDRDGALDLRLDLDVRDERLLVGRHTGLWYPYDPYEVSSVARVGVVLGEGPLGRSAGWAGAHYDLGVSVKGECRDERNGRARAGRQVPGGERVAPYLDGAADQVALVVVQEHHDGTCRTARGKRSTLCGQPSGGIRFWIS